MVLVFHQSMALSTLEAIHDLQHDSETFERIFYLNHVSCAKLQLCLVELICHDFALSHELEVL